MTETLFTVAPVLSEKQQLILDAAKNLGTLTVLQAAHELHAWNNCRHCTFGDTYVPCRYAEQNGRAVLEQLKEKGLLKRNVHHVYRLTDPPTAQTDQIPF